MEKSDLEKLRGYAAASRSQVNFAGATFIKFDWKTGKWTAGKAGTDMTNRKLVADLPDAMGGFQRLESGKKPLYALTRILDATVDAIARHELGDDNPAQWLDPDKDPWVPVTVLPFFDRETRQVFVVVAAYGARDAAANLIDALPDHVAAYPEAAEQLPLVQLCVREYIKSDGNPGYAAQFDVDTWVERPAAVLHIKPPPLSILEVVPKAAPTESTPTESTPTESSDKPKASAKPRRKIVAGGKTDMDDEIPFAPEWQG